MRDVVAHKKISENIWIIDGDAVPFFGMPYTTRMTMILLSNDDLWIHSPLKISNVLIDDILELGEVKFLISPNKLDHLFTSTCVTGHMRHSTEFLAKRPPARFR